jgi:heme oxygenase
VSNRLLHALRDITRTRHQALDAALGLDAERITRDRYVAFLRGSLAAARALEPSVARWLAPAGPSRAASLERDLTALGGAPPPRVDPFEPASLPEAVGCAYVIEGSALGGAVLAGRVERALRAAPTSYLRLHGSDPGHAWARWLRALDAHDAAMSGADRDRACGAACRTFELYARAFAAAGSICDDD